MTGLLCWHACESLEVLQGQHRRQEGLVKQAQSGPRELALIQQCTEAVLYSNTRNKDSKPHTQGKKKALLYKIKANGKCTMTIFNSPAL